MIMKYCPQCGHILVMKEISDEGLVPYCELCEKPFFNISYPCVILIVENEENKIAIIKQSYGVIKPVLIAGFVKCGHTLEETIKNEVKEEIDQEVQTIQYIKSFYHEKTSNLMVGFHVTVKKREFHLSQEVLSATWCDYAQAIEELKNSAIALDLVQTYLRGEKNESI